MKIVKMVGGGLERGEANDANEEREASWERGKKEVARPFDLRKIVGMGEKGEGRRKLPE